MAETVNVSRNWAMVPADTRKGQVKQKGKNIPTENGVFVSTSSVRFLYDNKEKMLANNKKSMILDVLNDKKGLGPLKKRLNFYGLFDKKYQNDESKLEKDDDLMDLTTIFIRGANITKAQMWKLDNAIAQLEIELGDEKATASNHKKSEFYEQALELAKERNLLVSGNYDNAYFSIENQDGEINRNDDGDVLGSLSLSYVEFSNGYLPTIHPFEHAEGKEALSSHEFNGETGSAYSLEDDSAHKGAMLTSTTLGYLKSFYGTQYQNLQMHTSNNGGNEKFWSVQVASVTPDQLTASWIAQFTEETREVMESADRINFSYVLNARDDVFIDKVLAFDPETGENDARMIFSGLVQDDFSKGDKAKYITLYETNPDKVEENKRYVNVRLRQGTFYTHRWLKSSEQQNENSSSTDKSDNTDPVENDDIDDIALV